MKTRNKILYRWVIVFSSVCLLLLLIGILSLPGYLESRISSTLLLRNAKASAIQVNLFTRSVLIKNLEWSSLPDSSNRTHYFKLNTLNIKRISLYKLFATKSIHVNQIVLDSGIIQFNTAIEQFIKDSFISVYHVFECNSILVNRVETKIVADSIVTFSALINFTLTNAAINLDSNKIASCSIKKYEGVINEINFSRHEGMYGGTIKRLSFNSQQQTITIDSALLIPNFTKYKFAQYLGEQAGRVNISIPKLLVEGVQFDSLLDSTFIASAILIQSFDLFSFKDKRIPFLRDYSIPLPMESFLGLAWKIKIDSIVAINSRITIEEFPAKGDELTRITFDEVNASLLYLNNRPDKNAPSFARMKASAVLMGSGKVEALLEFPLDGKSLYTARGSFSTFDLVNLNPVFIPIANIRIESGQLNSLTFDFAYSETESKGKLDIDYEGLKLLGLNKNNAKTHELKTFLISLLVKKNRDQSGRNVKAVGLIDIDRDRKRLIFHVWWRSILDGLKSILGRKGQKNRLKK